MSSSRGAASTCCTHQGDIPCGAWGGIAEVGGFFPGFPFPRGTCYFWCLVYPRQNKIYLFEVMAVLFGGSRSWCDVGTWLWGPFPNPVLVAKQLPNVAFWLADVAQFPVQIIEILSLKDADKCKQLLSRCYKYFAIVRKKKYLENMKILHTA